ncbi:MAG: 16S rRNA (cytidine(1402)-2'-O)-methyltransferase [Gammaproteobacteria bacterium]|nr:16S rRNA (cytidine(1402)-2'-O)-methyltransferase [Gammaproteobacteria bacterium]
MKKGQLYIVATPIGNLADISQRAIDTLSSVDLIAAEDTRHSRKLLSSLGIQSQLVSLHDHNERARSETMVGRLEAGENIALISDAGTPMISDPGYHMVRAAQDAGIKVSPIPGASAVISALSVAGLPANRFYFYGFLPEKQAARRAQLEKLAAIEETLVFYESGKRVTACLEDIAGSFGADREAVICREITKLHETILRDSVGNLLAGMQSGELEQRGEFVLLVAGAKAADSDVDMQLVKRLLAELGDSLPTGQAASAISKALGCPRKVVYQKALEMKGDG